MYSIIDNTILQHIKHKFQDYYFDGPIFYNTDANTYKIWNAKNVYFITFSGYEILFYFKTFDIREPKSIKKLMKLMRQVLNKS